MKGPSGTCTIPTGCCCLNVGVIFVLRLRQPCMILGRWHRTWWNWNLPIIWI